jgi:hypothetical protein
MRFRVLNENPLKDYQEACKITQGIDWGYSDYQFEPKNETEYWIKQIVANHSTLRAVRFRMVDEAPKSVIMQIIRATKGHPQPEVQSSRPDWCGKERSPDPYELKLFMQDHTAESFVEMAKQRLCARTEGKTREFMQKAVKALKQSGEPFLVAVGYCCKPYCEWYGSCPEIKSCGKSPSLSAWIIGEYKKDKEKS